MSALPDLLDPELILSLFSEQSDSAIKRFRQFDAAMNEDQCLEETQKVRLNDTEAKLEIKKLILGYDIVKIKSLPKAERDRILIKLKAVEGITQRQAARILRISPNLIFKA
jgi:putative transposase